ncbi:MAG: glucose-6-phosphate dehydrogenase [Acidobacteria bacterium]|nr:MAG: glucose-6-phosphate dehydrogenase [Acidobacteriota bacterium]
MKQVIQAGCKGYAPGRTPQPCTLVIFGASGDLTRRELMPALYQIFSRDLLPDPFAVIGFARRPWTDETFREEMKRAVSARTSVNAESWQTFSGRLFFTQGDFAEPGFESYRQLRDAVSKAQNNANIPKNVLFHLATPPEHYPTIVTGLKVSGLADSEAGWRRIVIEKPFGTNRESACALHQYLLQAFKEEQIYRIDHFLGKETVQNMLVFRFANPSFEPIWNRNYIDNVQISVAEEIGIEGRAAFYESTGVLRDMVQNHLLQLLCMVAMEPPLHFDALSLRNETVDVLRAIRPFDPAVDAVRGQYGPGDVRGNGAAGYRNEKGVSSSSNTPTFAALRMRVDNWRWAGVPFYLRTGKRMSRKRAEVTIEFKPTPHLMFPLDTSRPQQSNALTFRLQPEEGIIQRFIAKQPGPEICMQPVSMTLLYADAFGIEKPPSAYEWLLLDGMRGEQTLFARGDWVEAAWALVDPVISHWEATPAPDFPNYPAGSDGPEAASALLKKDAREWLNA